MKIIFLDIDGVLNNYDTPGELICWDPELVKILNRIIKETDAKIVLSSTWRKLKVYRDTIKNNVNYLGHKGTKLITRN